MPGKKQPDAESRSPRRTTNARLTPEEQAIVKQAIQDLEREEAAEKLEAAKVRRSGEKSK